MAAKLASEISLKTVDKLKMSRNPTEEEEKDEDE
jgi:hypothetical protein